MSDLKHWPAFKRVLLTRRPGTVVTVDSIRDDLTAAQIPHQALGALFVHAIHAGVLSTDGMGVKSTAPAARGRRVLLYRREPQKRAA